MNRKILIVGDLHGDWGKLNQLINKKQPDMVLQCGDFGWWPSMEVHKPVLYKHQREWKLHGLKVPEGCKVLWCDGNHEDHVVIRQDKFRGVNAVDCYPGVIYKPRGTTLTLDDGRVVLFYGGADSIDKKERLEGIDWFRNEVPNLLDYHRAMSHKRVDIVVSHTCPDVYVPTFNKLEKSSDPTCLQLTKIVDHYSPDLLYHGHWHVEATGKYKSTRIVSLDYPGHGGRWWTWLE